MTDKMREGFGKWLVQRRLGRLADFDGHLIDCTAVFWEAWQAAQSERKDKPAECVNGCPDKQVCDYCQGAAAIMPCGASVTNVYEAYDTGKKAAQSVPAAVMDSRCTYYSFAGSICNKCGRIHDGGKSVPVVGEVVAEYGFISDGQGTGTGTYGFWQIGNPNLAMGTKLIVQPTHSISAAELER
ncbi:MAG TPA: hypothetical protein VFY13_10335, partial [Luteolibacter sp.]|nr:hypothetical protein [Luteolibacter sp.]